MEPKEPKLLMEAIKEAYREARKTRTAAAFDQLLKTINELDLALQSYKIAPKKEKAKTRKPTMTAQEVITAIAELQKELRAVNIEGDYYRAMSIRRKIRRLKKLQQEMTEASSGNA